MAYQLDHKYFISLALQDKIAWDTLPFIIESFTSTLHSEHATLMVLLIGIDRPRSIVGTCSDG